MSSQFTEDQIYDGQAEWIRLHVGEHAAKVANYGWVVDEVEGTIATKVYGPDGGVLTTSLAEPTEHHFEPRGDN